MGILNRYSGILLPILILAPVTAVRAQSLDLRVESADIYVGMPFVLSVNATGFEEPAPEAPELAIAGCRVSFLGVSPNVSQGIQIINGRRSEWREVTFTYRYRVEAPAEGNYSVPSITVTQGSKSASTRPASFAVKPIRESKDMKLQVSLPERPVWVGETFEVGIDWLLSRDVGDHNFVVPLFDLDSVQVQPAPAASGPTLTFPAGDRNIDLPYTRDRVTANGTTYTRFRFLALATVNRPGTIELESARVAASLETGTRSDRFGFRVPRYQLAMAEDRPRRLTVRPLPQQGRPASFENAIGTAFSIDVQADRTVVQVGDPVELRVRIRGDGPLEGLSLPPLDGPGGLPAESFSVPDQNPVGELDAEGNGKTFQVTVRIKSAGAREIPALSFSYFDPEAAEYRTVRSRPIALSVAGSAVVDAGDVLSAEPARPQQPEGGAADAAAAASGGFATLIGADLSLSAGDRTLRRAWSARQVTQLVAALYVLPGFLFGFRSWQVRTRDRRGRRGELKKLLRDVEEALDAGRPALEGVPRIMNALRVLARHTGQEAALAAPEFQEIETRAFDPGARHETLSPEVSDRIRAVARGWVAAADRPSRSGRTAGILVLVLSGLAAGVTGLRAEAGEPELSKAREVYRAAIEEPDRSRRTRLFAEAERMLGELSAAHPSSPDLLTDWGNAALGARDIGTATLAYRRALRLDPGHHRARKNLAWLRDRAPQWLPRPPERGALDSLLFWHHTMSVSQRLLAGAAAFAAGMLLLAPWSRRRTRFLRRLAIPLFLIWIATTASALLAADGAREGVVLDDGVVLRSADSLGAPPILANPLPAGTELRVLEIRDSWTRVALADGTPGWIASRTMGLIEP